MTTRHHHLRIVGLVVVAILLVGVGPAAAVTIIGLTTPDDFDNATMTFTPFLAGALTDIAGFGFYHNHSLPPAIFTIDLRLDGVFKTIFSDSPADTSSHFLSGLPLPIDFADGQLDAIRFSTSVFQNQSWHDMGGLQFTFSDGIAAVPEPSSMLLLGTGLAGLAGWRRRRNRVATS